MSDRCRVCGVSAVCTDPKTVLCQKHEEPEIQRVMKENDISHKIAKDALCYIALPYLHNLIIVEDYLKAIRHFGSSRWDSLKLECMVEKERQKRLSRGIK